MNFDHEQLDFWEEHSMELLGGKDGFRSPRCDDESSQDTLKVLNKRQLGPGDHTETDMQAEV